MFQGPTSGVLVAGPTTGAIHTNPAEYIPESGLLIAQVAELRSQLHQRAKTSDLNTAIALREPLIQDGGLSIARTSGLQAALDERAKTGDLNTAIATREPLIQDGGLTVARSSGLQAALDERAKTSDVNVALFTKAIARRFGNEAERRHGLQSRSSPHKASPRFAGRQAGVARRHGGNRRLLALRH